MFTVITLISSTVTSYTPLGKSKIGAVVATTFGALLSIPVVDNSKKILKSIGIKNIVSSGVIVGLCTSILSTIINKESFKPGLTKAAAIQGGSFAITAVILGSSIVTDNSKKILKSTSTKNIVLSGVIAGLCTSILSTIINKESFKSGLIDAAVNAIGGGVGAALSRTISTKLENVDTEQPNIPGQSI